MNIKIPLRDYSLDKWKPLITESSKIPDKEKQHIIDFINHTCNYLDFGGCWKKTSR